jgi:hypothetical protein
LWRSETQLKLPTNVTPSKNWSVPDSLGAPVGAQALTKADILTSPETALTLASTVVVVAVAAFAKPGAPIIDTQLSKKHATRRLAYRARGVDEYLALRVLPILNLYKPTPLTAYAISRRRKVLLDEDPTQKSQRALRDVG